ncbi:MAG TPA: DUF3037 domain-containing protein [Solirubrobacteraceae bacterium]|nr:DUF3037 domain-containing protein [Solirubrobacteraceae bacterium]
MPGADPFTYAILRVVPSVERGERLNVGVVLFCRQRQFLGLRFAVDPVRLGALAPGLDLDEVTAHLQGLARVAEGAPDAGAVAAMPQSERFGWLVAPASTVVQASEVHTGLCEEPAATLDALFARLVD